MPCNWLPDVIEYASFKGEYTRFLDAAYKHLIHDFFELHVYLGCKAVHLPSPKLPDGKLKAFWHIAGDDDTDPKKCFDIRRVEKIPWIRAIIYNYQDAEVLFWKKERRLYFWLKKERYIVIIEEHTKVDILISAYVTDNETAYIRLERDYKKYKAEKSCIK